MTCKPAYHFIPVAPPETENGVHGNVKSVQHQVSSIGTTPSQHPSPETAGPSSRKVSNLFRHDRGLRGFRLWGAQVAYVPMNAICDI